jgi:hypothetical protein
MPGLSEINIPIGSSVIVYATPRSGSSALCDYLARTYRLKNYSEAFNPENKEGYCTAIELLAKVQIPCVIKIMPQDNVPVLFNRFIAKAYKIGLHRRALTEQIASLYIASETNKWHEMKVPPTDTNPVPINTAQLLVSIKTILGQTLKCSKRKDVDIRLYYEDIQELLSQSKYVKVSKPANYLDLIAKIEELLDEYLGYSSMNPYIR